MSRIQKIYTAITVFISVGFAVLCLLFLNSYMRFGETCVDLWNSLRFYFCEIFSIRQNFDVTVNDYSKYLSWASWLPSSWADMKDNFVLFWQRVVDKENFFNYIGQLNLATVGKIVIVIIPVVLLLWLVFKQMYKSSNTKHNVDTRPLKCWKWISARIVHPTRRFVQGYLRFVQEHRVIWIVWLVVWAFHLNLPSIVFGFFAYYFYVSISFDFSTIYVQFCKLVIDLQVALKTIPVFVWIILAAVIFDWWRKRLALNKLRHFEARNCGFINELPIVSMTCGSMGKKKTTVITDMALSQEVMFKQEAFDRLQKQDLKFPNFPWIEFELELRKCMEHHVVYNLATVKDWVRLKRSRFESHHNVHWQLYDYDLARYGSTYNDALKVESIWDVLETYAQLYFIYVITSSLLVANYSIRTDNELIDRGNFPMWYTNFFPETVTCDTRHSHILDFDVLRLGKKVIDYNPNSGSFEFGVVVMTEVGKERGNNLELKETKKNSDDANQKNDLFNSYLKMCRHSATVDNFPFIKIFTDEQRPESWGADARDLCDIVQIVSSGEQRLTLPFYTIEDMLAEWAFNHFMRLYYDFRFRRGDNTLLVHILKNVTAWIWRRNTRIYNKYGYCQTKIEKERGTMDGKVEKKKYFLMNKKIYSSRFSTDCFSDYFNEMARQTHVGLNDYREYATEKASVDELLQQNSYFINSLYRR